MSRSSWLLILLAALDGFLCGCSGSAATKVTGSVTLDGKPLADAQVYFSPKEDLKQQGGVGLTGPDGKFEVMPDPRTKEMLKPGKYVALISKKVLRDGTLPQGEELGQAEAAGKLHSAVPEKYGDPQQSPFTVDIQPGGNALPPFELKSKP